MYSKVLPSHWQRNDSSCTQIKYVKARTCIYMHTNQHLNSNKTGAKEYQTTLHTRTALISLVVDCPPSNHLWYLKNCGQLLSSLVVSPMVQQENDTAMGFTYGNHFQCLTLITWNWILFFKHHYILQKLAWDK